MEAKMEKEKRFYVIETKFVFEGQFCVKAQNKKDAMNIVKEQCWIEGNIKSNISDEEIGWMFPRSQTKKIVSI
jgi:hypothetical protein